MDADDNNYSDNEDNNMDDDDDDDRSNRNDDDNEDNDNNNDAPDPDDQGAPEPDGDNQGAPEQAPHHEISDDDELDDDPDDAEPGTEDDEPIEDEEPHEDLDDPVPRPYNLRQRRQPTNSFRRAMDSPHDNKSYFPPAQQMLHHGHPNFTFSQLVSHVANCVSPNPTRNLTKHVFGFILNQMSAKAGIRKHGKAAEEALMREFAQLEQLSVYEFLDPATLTPEQSKPRSAQSTCSRKSETAPSRAAL